MSSTVKMIPVSEAAERLGIRPRDVYRLIDHGKLPGFKGPRVSIVVPEDALANIDPADLEAAS